MHTNFSSCIEQKISANYRELESDLEVKPRLNTNSDPTKE